LEFEVDEASASFLRIDDCQCIYASFSGAWKLGLNVRHVAFGTYRAQKFATAALDKVS
jgi:hypothetical protein